MLMTFIPPNLELLRISANNLDARFSTLIGRYQISAPETATAASQRKQSTLEILIARTNDSVTSCTTDRVTQQEVFSKLVDDELRPVLQEGNEAKCKQASLILLGALLHRYFRLLNEYKPVKEPLFGFSIYNWDIKKCRFFLAIREALHLPKDMPSDYRKTDLDKLDVTTIVTALECFQSHMLLADHYKSYPHFAADEHFQPYLQAIIDEHKKRGLSILNQFKAISFIQSLVKKLYEEQQQMEDELDKWIIALKKDHIDFALLNIETIEAHVKTHIENRLLQEKILDLLYTPCIKNNLASFTHERFVLEMKNCNSHRSSYMVMGGCSLILESGAAYDKLKHCIFQLLGTGLEPEKITDKDKLNGMSLLSEYIEATPAVDFDVQFFGDIGKFKSDVARLTKALVDRRLEQSTDLEVVTASM